MGICFVCFVLVLLSDVWIKLSVRVTRRARRFVRFVLRWLKLLCVSV